MHSGPSGGGAHGDYQISRVKERSYWSQMKSSVQLYISSCKESTKNKTSHIKGQVPLQSMAISEPLTFWAMDCMGLLPETAVENKHILVVGGHFTEWCVAFLTQDQKA